MTTEDEYSPTLLYMDRKEFIAKLDHVRLRLYTENRLNGDEMRDLAHVLTDIYDNIVDKETTAQIVEGIS